MYRTLKLGLVTSLAALAVSVPALAQTEGTGAAAENPAAAAPATAGVTDSNEELGATITGPAGWVQFDSNDRVTFGFRHEESQSQIEVIAQPLMTAEVGEVFFNTFHTTLTSSGFQQLGRENRTYGTFSGSETVYSFSHSGVALKVAVFQFVSNSTAWLVVAYVQEDQFDTYRPAYESTIGGLTISG